jgi:hypothetical protein
VALSAALGTAVAAEAEPTAPVVAGVASAVLLVSLALLTGRAAPISFSLVLLGAVYVVPDGDREIWAPLYGSGLLLLAELAYWSLESRVDQRVYGDVVTPRLVAVLLVASLSVPAGALVLLAADAGVGRSPAMTAVAALAVIACVGLLAVLATAPGRGAQRTPSSTSTTS